MTYSASWRSPSNIALIKYWGKHGLQLPRNPSLSFTLSACNTEMRMEVTTSSSPSLEVRYEGTPKPSFEPKIKTLLEKVGDRFPWISQARIIIDSRNTFPHGAGIASSASAMSALALCLCDIDDQISGSPADLNKGWWQNVSEIARLGSGSACRSVYPGAAIWGYSTEIGESSDLYALPWQQHLADIYKEYRDTILIISAAEKSVSSTAGHQLMSGHPYADVRYAEAGRNLIRLTEAMAVDNAQDLFISIVESEALQLHALMMSGHSPFILIEPATISVIRHIWTFRRETGIPVCFTLDAGPNVHLLYPSKHESSVMSWVNETLRPFCVDGRYIVDHVGEGPEKIS